MDPFLAMSMTDKDSSKTFKSIARKVIFTTIDKENKMQRLFYKTTGRMRTLARTLIYY